MERDFFGINGKDLESQVKEGSRQDSAFLRGSVGPFANKISALQQFMSYRAGQGEERHKKISFNQFPSSGFQPIPTVDAFEANCKPSPIQAQQKCYSFDRQGAHQFPMHSYQSLLHGGSPYGPNVTMKQQPSGGVAVAPVGAFAPRNTSIPSAQLTIFYDGSVNVYNDVPLDKAQAIMFSASKGSNAPTTILNSIPEVPVSIFSIVAGVDGLTMDLAPMKTPTPNPTPNLTPTPNNAASPCPGISSPNSFTSHAGNHNSSSSSTTNDVAVVKNIGPLAQQEPSKNATAPLASGAPNTVVKRAIPQARKASLVRFLEKRKERVTNAAPYSISKKPLENVDELYAPSGNHPMNIDTIPSTKLEM